MSTDLEALQRATIAAASETTRISWPPQAQLNALHLAAFAAARGHAVLASTRADGRPHATPADFVLEGVDLWSPTGERALRRRNVRRMPRMSAVISSGDGARHAVIVLEGTVREAGPAEIPSATLAAYEAKYGRGPLAIDGWLVLTAERAFSFHGPDWTPPPASTHAEPNPTRTTS